MLKQIGNAVPPMLAHAAARMMRAVLAATEGDPEPVREPIQAVLPMSLARDRSGATPVSA